MTEQPLNDNPSPSQGAAPAPVREHELTPVRPRCGRCGYDLRATVTLSGALCPECGAKLPFDQLRHGRKRFQLRLPPRNRRSMLTVGLLIGLVILTAITGSRGGSPSLDLSVVAATAAGMSCAWAVLLLIPAKRNFHPTLLWWVAASIPLGILCAVGLRNEHWVMLTVVTAAAGLVIAVRVLRPRWVGRVGPLITAHIDHLIGRVR